MLKGAIRSVDYTDDGCTVYECLTCYSRYEGRTPPCNTRELNGELTFQWVFSYCPFCGVKLNQYLPEKVPRFDSWDIARHDRRPRRVWLISKQRILPGEDEGEEDIKFSPTLTRLNFEGHRAKSVFDFITYERKRAKEDEEVVDIKVRVTDAHADDFIL